MKNESKYSLEVYEHCAIIKGKIPSFVFVRLIELCELEGFNFIADPDGTGMMLVKKIKEDEGV